jgi:hypothetical protein
MLANLVVLGFYWPLPGGRASAAPLVQFNSMYESTYFVRSEHAYASETRVQTPTRE